MSKRLPTQLLECRRHVHFIEHARRHIPAPTAELLQNPSDELVAALDQFVYRFSKLQDTLGRKVLRAVLVEHFREPYEDAPFRDVLDRLEALRIVDSADRWDEYRVVRNALVHDYPESAAEKAQVLSEGFTMSTELANLVDRLTELLK